MKNIAINVRRLRLSKGLSQGQLAKMAGVSRPTIGTLEDVSGDSSSSLRTLEKVAKAFDVDMSELLKERNMPSRVRFRALREFKSREQVVVDALHAYEMYQRLEDATNDRLGPGQGLRQFREELTFPKGTSGIDRARGSARALRKRVGLGSLDSPVPRITNLIEQLDIRIITIPYHTDAFGLSFESADLNPVIVVNMSDRLTVERWIFSAAHELGHLILHWDREMSFENATEDIEEENEANQFAAELLIPREGFKKMWNSLDGELLIDKVMAIKRRYVVSYQTVLHRVSDLSTAPDAYKTLLGEFLEQYRVRYGVTLTRKEEGAIRAHRSNYDPDIIPVSSTSEEPENAGSGMPRTNIFLPQGRMMRLLINGITEGKITPSEVEHILYTSPEDARYFVQRVRGMAD